LTGYWSDGEILYHSIQFWETDTFFVDAVSAFISTDLSAGDACIVLAQQHHRESLEERLQKDGRDIVKRLKSQEATRNVPVIMFSAHLNAEKSARKAGADDFVAKPFEMDEVLAKIAKRVLPGDRSNHLDGSQTPPAYISPRI
jgi:CheY-like chemotaxis protein